MKPKGEAAFNDLLYRFKRAAKKRGIKWGLPPEEVRDLTGTECSYCGCLPAQSVKHPHYRGDYLYNGLDRIDNDKGYVSGNVAPCCGTCNRMKGTMSIEDFMAHIGRIKIYLVKQQEDVKTEVDRKVVTKMLCFVYGTYTGYAL